MREAVIELPEGRRHPRQGGPLEQFAADLSPSTGPIMGWQQQPCKKSGSIRINLASFRIALSPLMLETLLNRLAFRLALDAERCAVGMSSLLTFRSMPHSAAAWRSAPAVFSRATRVQ